MLFQGRAQNVCAEPVLKSTIKLSFRNFCFWRLVQYSTKSFPQPKDSEGTEVSLMISLVSSKDLFFQSSHCVARRKKKWVLGSKDPPSVQVCIKKGSLPLKACLSLFLFLDHINRRVTPAHKLNMSGSDQYTEAFAMHETHMCCHVHVNPVQDWMCRFLSFCGVYLLLHNPQTTLCPWKKNLRISELFLTYK